MINNDYKLHVYEFTCWSLGHAVIAAYCAILHSAYSAAILLRFDCWSMLRQVLHKQLQHSTYNDVQLVLLTCMCQACQHKYDKLVTLSGRRMSLGNHIHVDTQAHLLAVIVCCWHALFCHMHG